MMENTIQTLLNHYHDQLSRSESPNPQWVNHYNDLRLVDACQDKVNLNEQHPQHPLQVGVVGPTQAGKSTLINILTHSQAGGVSARAGYTVHAQGFAVGTNDADLEPICTVLEPMRRVNAEELDREDLDAYLLEIVQAGPNALITNSVVWDSPDFDSIEARGYRGAVLYTLALSDVVILMVSKDKYGDKSVWDMLSLMVPLNKPLVVVINKLDEKDEAAVRRSFNDRFQERFSDVTPPSVFALPYVDDINQFTESHLDGLHQSLTRLQQSNDRTLLQPAISQFIDENWSRWIEPAMHERSAHDTWVEAVNDAVEDAFSQYESRYLDDDSRNDTFNRALAELLTLLEFPGIAASLQKTRELVTWPARKLFGLGMSAVRRDAANAPPANLERDVLSSVQAHVLTKLQGVAVDAQQELPEQALWWQALGHELKRQKNSIAQSFDASAEQYREDFEPRIDAAAQRLYQQLETQPALLNSLRAARVTTDAAAVALAVKSGGLAATDLLVAPAMLSVTTLLTESVLGRYMSTVKADLKREQRTEVQEKIFAGVLGAALHNLPNSMDNRELLGLDLNDLSQNQHSLTKSPS